MPAQAPLPQVSDVEHALPSLHGRLLARNTQPVVVEHESLVHTLLSLQVTATPLQTPAAHRSPLVQALLSLHAVPVVSVCTQPVAGSHVSTVQTLPSLQLGVMSVCTQPVDGSHVSAVHALPSLQFMAVPARQLPPPHVSPVVHAFPSLQAAALFVNTHPVPGLQLSVVQTLPSVQEAVVSVKTHPVAGAQVSAVHRLLSLQTRLPVGVQFPATQRSPVVHTLPSLHAEFSVRT